LNLILAALPVTLLTALSKSPLGTKVQDDLQKVSNMWIVRALMGVQLSSAPTIFLDSMALVELSRKRLNLAWQSGISNLDQLVFYITSAHALMRAAPAWPASRGKKSIAQLKGVHTSYYASILGYLARI
jgi:hypothetical protein